MSNKTYTSLLCPTERVTEEQLETDRNLLNFERSMKNLPRRGFLTAMLGTAAAVTAGTFDLRSADAQTSSTVLNVLNFALNLEYLEANFYLNVSSGTTLPSSSTSGSGTAGTLVGLPGKLNLDSYTLAVAKALAQDEVNHVNLLRSAISSLGGTPIAQPTINYAANGAITNQVQFLTAARQFTALGGSAYVGGAQLLVSNTSVLTTAAQILGAEGQHAGALNYECVRQGVTSPMIDAQDRVPTSTLYFTVGGSALGPSRNTSQVLGVAYGVSNASTTNPNTGTSKGGFFPNGVNGAITTT